MRNSTLTFLAVLMATPLVACTGGDGSGTPDRQPFRDEWRVEADVAFVHTFEEMVQISDITIGGREFNKNFANRGDVIVNFDGPQDKILVEFRRFTTNTSEEAAQLDFDAMSLWAFNTGVAQPTRPDLVTPPEANCVTDGWLSGCGVRVYYDGQTQLVRAGADIRVTLPSDYRRTVKVITEDTDADSDYFNRGNVCVNGTNGTVDVELQSGEAFVTVSDEATPAPACGLPPNTKSNPSDEVDFCNNYEKDDMNAAWSTDCQCAMTGEYGVVKVESEASASSNITIDLPSALWAAITVENLGDDPEDCTGDINLAGVVFDENVGNEFPWEAKGTVNTPSPAVTPGAGYNVQARSGQCGPVAYTEDPNDFVGVNSGAMQKTEQRGNIEVCADCIRGMSCEQLLP